MYRKVLICLFASIALVIAQSPNDTSVANVTTISPNSTSATGKPTTLAPTTNKTEVPTTTAKPNTTVAPTPEPTPGPIPSVEKFTGNVTVIDTKTNTTNTCIQVQFSVKITIKYKNTNNETKTTGFVIPANATVNTSSSHCSQNTSNTEAITIYFNNEEHTSAILTLTFNTSDSNVFVEDIALSFNATQDLFPLLDPKLQNTIVNSNNNKPLSLFKVATVHSYTCSAAQSAQLEVSQENITGVQIEFMDSKVEAYIDESKRGKFDSEIDCKSADISDVVPIAVGAALAGLVIIVLIAYFIGRRRSRRLAYQSV